MWTLILLIATYVGGPEKAYKIPTDFPMTTFDECDQRRREIWAQMNASYPLEEQKLYRFICKGPSL